MDRFELEVELFWVRQCRGHQDASKCSLEARHTHVQQVRSLSMICQPIKLIWDLGSGFPRVVSCVGGIVWKSAVQRCLSFPRPLNMPNSRPAWPSEFLKTAHSTFSFGKLLAVEPYSAYFPLGLKLYNKIYENVARISSRSIQLCNQMHLRIFTQPCPRRWRN